MRKEQILIIAIITISLLTLISKADVVIFPTQTAKLNTTGASGGILPYTYTWYNKCPSCGTYNAFANSNTTVFYWITNSATQTGKWTMFVNAVDSSGANTVNSAVTNVIVINYSYTYNVPLSIKGNIISLNYGHGLSVNGTGFLISNASECLDCNSIFDINSINGIPGTTSQITLITENHILFILMFAGAIIFIIVFLIVLPQDLKKESIRPLFLLLFAIGFWIATIPAMLAPENIISIAYPSYNVIQANVPIQFPSFIVNATSKLPVRAYNAYFYIWLIFLGFLFFLLLLWWILLLRTKAANLLKAGGDVMEQLNKKGRK